MKKIIALLAVCVLMSCPLASCGKDEDSSTDTAAKASESSEPETKDDKAEKKEDVSVEGTWTLSEEAVNSLIGADSVSQIESQGMKLGESSLTFSGGSDMKFRVSFDCSQLMSLSDSGFTLQGQQLDILSFDGTNLEIGTDCSTLVTFQKKEPSDDKYGEYNYPQEMGIMIGDEAGVEFRESGVAFINVSFNGSYEHDKDAGTLSITMNGRTGSPAEIEVDGDTMTVNDGGETFTLTRKN